MHTETPGRTAALDRTLMALADPTRRSILHRLSRGPARVTEVGGLIARPDGNDVSLDREGLNLAEAQLKFKTGVALLKLEDQQVMDAIHAGGK